ncbi:MAG: hypothetical protein IPK13_21340 [Deltaproteobacteria bacterium]|nr:hypothetical protein [Deltaproteobacteria bacterium]
MTDQEHEPRPTKPLMLLLPDWQHLDTVRRASVPFVLWQVGDQPLLFHWLDYAVDRGHDFVTLVCGDRPAEVRAAMETAALWPIRWTVVPVMKAETMESAYTVNRLPDTLGRPAAPTPKDGWALLDLWFRLRREWFDLMASSEMEGIRLIAVGRYCSIHPTAELRMPLWIEDHVHIGPNCVIGPNVNLGKGTIVEGPSVIENAVITEFTYLTGHTELTDAYLDGGLLLNLRHRARIDCVEMLVSSSLRQPNERPRILERIAAFAGFVAFTLAAALIPHRAGPTKTFSSFKGRTISETTGPLWRRRRRWLLEVVRGRMRLFGILPRSRSHLNGVSADWREILERAPAGVFSYADLHGAHSADDEMEAIHAVYQATSERSEMRQVFRSSLWRLLTIDPDAHRDMTSAIEDVSGEA